MPIAIVLGTYNRLELLRGCLESVRLAAAKAGYPYRIVVVDGGSSDGTLTYLREQADVHLLEQGKLLGAVKAFNAGFSYAVDLGAEYVMVINDDDRLLEPWDHIRGPINLMGEDAKIGAVAYETNLRGAWSFEEWNGKPYANKGLFRTSASMAAARAMGDETGREWWGHEHLTYAADTEHGLWLWRLGWRIERGYGLRVDDPSERSPDALRKKNVTEYLHSGTHKLFHARWNSPRDADYSREDARRFGGRL